MAVHKQVFWFEATVQEIALVAPVDTKQQLPEVALQGMLTLHQVANIL